MYTYRTKFEKVLNQINSCSDLEINKIEGPDGIPASKYDDEALMSMYERSIQSGLVIPEAFVQLYLVGPKLRWDWKSKKYPELVGVLNLFHLKTALASGYNGQQGQDFGTNRFVFAESAPAVFVNYGTEKWEQLSDEQKDFFRLARYIDANQQSGIYVCIKQIEAADGLAYNHDELWLFNDQTFEFVQLNTTLTDYFDLLTLTKGATFWQYLLLDNPENYVDAYILKYVLLGLINLESTFPEEDYTPLYSIFNDTYQRLAEQIIGQNPSSELASMLEQFQTLKNRHKA